MSNLKAINAYRMYLAVKMHFMTDKYDITVSKDHIRVSQKKFAERNQFGLYEKLADKFDTKQELAQYLVSNFAYGAWGNTDIVYGSAENDQMHLEWQRRKQSITQIFKTDLSYIRLHYETNGLNFKDDVGSKFPNIAALFHMFLGGHITLETVVILDSFHPFLDSWKQSMGSLFADEIRRIIKAKPFIKFDKTKLEKSFMEFSEE